jgi:hypothetical protein
MEVSGNGLWPLKRLPSSRICLRDTQLPRTALRSPAARLKGGASIKRTTILPQSPMRL